MQQYYTTYSLPTTGVEYRCIFSISKLTSMFHESTTNIIARQKPIMPNINVALFARNTHVSIEDKKKTKTTNKNVKQYYVDRKNVWIRSNRVNFHEHYIFIWHLYMVWVGGFFFGSVRCRVIIYWGNNVDNAQLRDLNEL